MRPPRQHHAPAPQAGTDLVGEKYHIRSHEVSDDYLDVYVVADAHGACFEAQAFAPVGEMPREREGLRQARRRRMRRICRSPNFADEFEHDGRRFLVSRVQRSGKEWTDLQGLGRRQGRESSPRERGSDDGEVAKVCPGSGGSGTGRWPLSYAEAAVARTQEFSGGMNPPAERRRVCLRLGGSKGFK